MQPLNSPEGNHVARVSLVPKTSMYIHLRAAEVLSRSVVLCFEQFTVQSQSRTSESVLSHSSPPLGGHLPRARWCQKRSCLTLANDLLLRPFFWRHYTRRNNPIKPDTRLLQTHQLSGLVPWEVGMLQPRLCPDRKKKSFSKREKKALVKCLVLCKYV